MYVVVGQGHWLQAHTFVVVEPSFTIRKRESRNRYLVHEVRKYVGSSIRMNQSGMREEVDRKRQRHLGNTVEVGGGIRARAGEGGRVGAGAGVGIGIGEGEEAGVEAEAEAEPKPAEPL